MYELDGSAIRRLAPHNILDLTLSGSAVEVLQQFRSFGQEVSDYPWHAR